MLDNYKDKQSVAYNLLINEINNNKISHAYLIDENNNSDAFSFVLAFIKTMLCSDDKLSDKDKEYLCKRIDEGNYPELKIIEPDGMYIKKKQVLDLQQEFSRSAIEGGKRVYIIKDCDKMRSETSNSMLKFLEEPDNNIIAILMTNNYNNILSTIISRCQIIKLNSDIVINNNDEDEEIAINFISSLENRGISTLLNVSSLWFDKVGTKDREKMMLIFDIMIDIYYDILKLKLNIIDIKYNKYKDKLCLFVDNNNESSLLYKINYLLECKDSIKFNVNSSLLMDSVIINIGGNYCGSRY